MRPGYPVVYAVLTLDDSLAAGGMLWASDSVSRIMVNMKYVVENTEVTNEDIPQQLPEYLDALQQRVQKYKAAKSGPKKGKARKAELALPLDLMALPSFSEQDQQSLSELVTFLKDKDILSCKCSGACVTNVEEREQEEDPLCPCWRGSAVHHRGCTIWCNHEGYYGDPPACAE